MTDDSSHSADEAASGTPDPAETESPRTTDETAGTATASGDSDGSTEVASGAATTAPGPSKNTRLLVTAVAGVAALAALVCAIIFGISGYKIYTDDKPTQSAREDATVSAENAIINITTIDPTNIKDWQRRIDSSLTGDARSQITPDDFKKLTQQIEEAGTTKVAKLSSRVLRSAPVEVNAEDGTARVLIYVEATSKREFGSNVRWRTRMPRRVLCFRRRSRATGCRSRDELASIGRRGLRRLRALCRRR